MTAGCSDDGYRKGLSKKPLHKQSTPLEDLENQTSLEDLENQTSR
jgi:hypothetical protein